MPLYASLWGNLFFCLYYSILVHTATTSERDQGKCKEPQIYFCACFQRVIPRRLHVEVTRTVEHTLKSISVPAVTCALSSAPGPILTQQPGTHIRPAVCPAWMQGLLAWEFRIPDQGKRGHCRKSLALRRRSGHLACKRAGRAIMAYVQVPHSQ